MPARVLKLIQPQSSDAVSQCQAPASIGPVKIKKERMSSSASVGSIDATVKIKKERLSSEQVSNKFYCLCPYCGWVAR